MQQPRVLGRPKWIQLELQIPWHEHLLLFNVTYWSKETRLFCYSSQINGFFSVQTESINMKDS